MTKTELAELKAGIDKTMSTVPDTAKDQKLVTVKAAQLLYLIGQAGASNTGK